MMFIDRLRPPLSSVRVPQREIGYGAADLLLEQLTNEDTAPREVMLEPSAGASRLDGAACALIA